jgi:GntR family transcriptional regulator
MTALEHDDSPVYLKLRALIAAAILRGQYRAGDQLPSVRALAAEHGANPLTVAKAYQSFQDDGYVEVRRGVGMFVLQGAVERLRVAERERFLTGYCPRVREHIALLGLDARDLLAQDRELA